MPTLNSPLPVDIIASISLSWGTGLDDVSVELRGEVWDEDSLEQLGGVVY